MVPFSAQAAAAPGTTLRTTHAHAEKIEKIGPMLKRSGALQSPEYIIWEDLGLAAKLPAAQQAKRTKVDFCLDYAQEVFDRVAPMRRRTPVAMCVMRAGATNSADYLSPASAHAMKLAEHELVDMGAVVRKLGYRTQKKPEGPKKRKRVPNGVCNYGGCPGADNGWAKFPQLRCGSCKDGDGAFYHLPCFHATHRCTFSG